MRLLPAALIFLTIGPMPWTGFRYPVVDHSQTATARPLVYPAGGTGSLRFVAGWRLTSRNSLFGSYSALVAPAPGRLLAISDRGHFLAFAVPGGEAAPVRLRQRRAGSSPATNR